MQTIKGNAIQIVNYLMTVEDKLTIKYELSEIKKKRSITQNAYLWELVSKLADALRISKDEVYEQMLWSYGQTIILPMLSEINPAGWFKYYKEFKRSMAKGREYTYWKIAKGSSEYDKEEMAILLDGVIMECHQLGIETMTPEEISRLKL